MPRKVIVELRIPIVYEVPDDWEPSLIEFFRRGSSACADGWFNSIKELDVKLENSADCMCQVINHRYVREATEEESRTNVCLDESITEDEWSTSEDD